MVDELQQLEYTFTNENLEAIVSGLDIGLSDVVLASGGSGDQAFALLEYAQEVIVVDYDSAQIEFINRRIKLLQTGYIQGLGMNQYGRRNHSSEQVILQVQNMYFAQEGRVQRIKSRLNDLAVRQGNILEIAQITPKITKVYLSNCLGYEGESQLNNARNILQQIARNLPQGGLIYVSNDDEFTNYGNLGYKKENLPVELIKDDDLTVKARRLEAEKWQPVVYRRV